MSDAIYDQLMSLAPPDAPRLTITFHSPLSILTVSWPLSADGWVLEATNALPQVSAPWPQVQRPYQTNGMKLEVIEPLPAGNKFYRLYRP